MIVRGAGCRGALAGAIVAGLLFAVLFGPDLLDERVPAFRDVANYHLPVGKVVADQWRAGRVPCWNPFVACGTPLLSNPNHYALYPGRVADLVLGAEAAMTLHLLGHWVAGGVAFAALLAVLGCGVIGAAGGAAAYLLAGPSLSLLSFANLVPFLLWTPLTALAWVAMLRRPGPGPAAGLALTVAVQACFAEPVLLASEVLVLLAIPFAVERRAPVRSVIPWAMAGAGTALLVAAPMAVPALRLASESARSVDSRAALEYSVGPWSLPRILVPGFFGNYHTLEKTEWWGELLQRGRGPFYVSLAVGLPAVLLAVAGFASRGRRGGVLLGAVALAVAVAMGSHCAPVAALAATGAGGWFRWPVKFLFAVAFLIPLGVGLGLRDLERGARSDRSTPAVWIAGAASLLATAVAWKFAGAETTAQLRDGFFGPVAEMKDLDAIFQALRTALFGTAAGGVAVAGLLLARSRAGGRRLLAWAGVGVVAASLVPAQRGVNRGTPLEALRAPSPVMDEVAAEVHPQYRAWFPTSHWEARLSTRAGFPDEWWPRVQLDREVGNFFQPIREGIRQVIVNPDRLVRADAAERARMSRLISAADRERLFDLIGVRATVSLGPAALAGDRPPHRTIARWPAGVSVRPGAVPIAVPLHALPEPAGSPWGGPWLREAHAAVDRLRSDTVVEVVESEPGRWVFRVNGIRPGWLAVTETAHAGWVATVDGERVSVVPYLESFLAVPVSAGDHEVSLSWTPPGFVALLVVSGVGLALAALFAGLGVRRAHG
ncbi:MAG: YfhO family protein [Gemmatimonadota bacterium]|nr:hypothetical protein [Gemmatimonadota bacterium]MDP6461974.1 YfhO family protein [Gemmatimonadota bacterium]MDP6528198.1 YfhO family protein [Gemmatimonadota bacterium]MDP6802003.1 YfhO family protein [Gemmatimonadota bacterium]MDP7031351.1 YfhO family protein [Gemmatimonadota bacterium]